MDHSGMQNNAFLLCDGVATWLSVSGCVLPSDPCFPPVTTAPGVLFTLE